MFESWNAEKLKCSCGRVNHRLLRWTDENSKLTQSMNHTMPVYETFILIKTLGDGQTCHISEMRCVVDQVSGAEGFYFCARLWKKKSLYSPHMSREFLSSAKVSKSSWWFSSRRCLSWLCFCSVLQCCEIGPLRIRVRAKPQTAAILNCENIKTLKSSSITNNQDSQFGAASHRKVQLRTSWTFKVKPSFGPVMPKDDES